MKDQFGLILLIIVLVILVGGFAGFAWGRRPRTPRGTDTAARRETREHEKRRRDDE
jgi:uncharacterized membrane protein